MHNLEELNHEKDQINKNFDDAIKKINTLKHLVECEEPIPYANISDDYEKIDHHVIEAANGINRYFDMIRQNREEEE